MTSTDLLLSKPSDDTSSARSGYRGTARRRDWETGSQLLVPIVVVLIFVGIINSLQAFYIFFGGERTLMNFMRFVISNLFYSLYFILPALAVRALSVRVHIRKSSVASWVPIHLATLLLLTVIHQVSSLEVDRLVLGSRQTDTVFSVLLNNPGVWGDLVVYVLFLLGFYMIEYRKRIQENEMTYSVLEVELVRARLHELRGRIHPQFLFNTLNEIRSLVGRSREKEANRVLSMLSDFLRVTVYGGEEEETRLKDELGFLDNYLAIEEIRFGERLKVKRKIDGNVERAVVPNFILQPLVEEMILERLEGPGTQCEIEVAVGKVDGQLEMTITSRGTGPLDVPGQSDPDGNAIEITRERLAQLYPGRHEFHVEKIHRTVETVKVRIPFRSMSDFSKAIPEKST